MKYIVLLLLLMSVAVHAQDAQPSTTINPDPLVVVNPVVVASPTQPTVGYDKGFFIQSADERFKMSMGGYIQGLLESRYVEAGPDTDTFRVRRARINWKGHMFSKNVKYELEYDFASSKFLEGVIQLVSSDALKGNIGQYHVPFSLEQATSSSTLQFVDRSILQAFFGIADEREPGAGISGELMDKKLEYNIGAFNGEGINTLNLNNEFRFAGRFVYNLKGKYGTEFSDYKISEEPSIAIGLGGMFNDTPDPATIPVGGTVALDEKKVDTFVADLGTRYKGFSGHGEYMYQKTDPDVAASTSDHGWMEQMGYMINPKWEIAERVAQIYPEAGSDTAEYTLGVNYFLFDGHKVKFQMDYSALTTSDGVAAGDDRWDHRVRAQFQIKI